jgi:hypothetical protein
VGRPKTTNPAKGTIRRWRHEERRAARLAVYAIELHEDDYGPMITQGWIANGLETDPAQVSAALQRIVRSVLHPPEADDDHSERVRLRVRATM